MRRLVLAFMLPVACLSIHAEQTGRISGKVTTKDGKPVPGAKLNLKRTDRAWSKDLITDKNGNYMQVGLEPKEYTLMVTAEGFVEYKEKDPIKIPLADVLLKNITMYTQAEARAMALAGGGQVVAADPAATQDAEGRESFNQAIPLYNEGKFSEALPLVEKAYKLLNEAVTNLKDAQAKADLAPEVTKIERVLGICLAQAGAKKEDGEPYLLKALERNPKDERVIAALVETSKAKADKVAEAKYTAMLEAIHGPNPNVEYNKGVEAFNSGNSKQAKAHWLKTLEIAPTYGEAHYMLGMVEYGDNNLRGTKMHFEKYLEVSPTGKHAAEVKEMLKDPSLKKIK